MVGVIKKTKGPRHMANLWTKLAMQHREPPWHTICHDGPCALIVLTLMLPLIYFRKFIYDKCIGPAMLEHSKIHKCLHGHTSNLILRWMMRALGCIVERNRIICLFSHWGQSCFHATHRFAWSSDFSERNWLARWGAFVRSFVRIKLLWLPWLYRLHSENLTVDGGWSRCQIQSQFCDQSCWAERCQQSICDRWK